MSQIEPRYLPIAIGCCFYERFPNYQAIVRSIEKMTSSYSNEVKAFIYFSDASAQSARDQIKMIEFERRDIFTFDYGPNRLDEPKYKLPLVSKMPFIVTLDDDRVFGEDTLTILMDAYNEAQTRDPQRCGLSPVGWDGTVIEDGKLVTPIEDRYNLLPRQLQQVDYVGSCGCLYRRELLEDERLSYENWPSFIGSASDVWLSYLVASDYRVPMYLTGLHKTDLPEHGHSLWEDSTSRVLPGIVERLVSYGWKSHLQVEGVR